MKHFHLRRNHYHFPTIKLFGFIAQELLQPYWASTLNSFIVPSLLFHLLLIQNISSSIYPSFDTSYLQRAPDKFRNFLELSALSLNWLTIFRSYSKNIESNNSKERMRQINLIILIITNFQFKNLMAIRGF